MGAETKIAWADSTFNPWWGCQRVSKGCEHCYAEAFDKRLGRADWGPRAPRRFFGENHWREPLKWNAKAGGEGRRQRVFCASMADVFEDRVDLLVERERLWRLILATPNLDWMLLTKRPENVARMLPWTPEGCGNVTCKASMRDGVCCGEDFCDIADGGRGCDPWPNVWIGTTVEDEAATSRIPILRQIPAIVRFASFEPLIGPIHESVDLRDIHWGIIGGESGAGARPFVLDWGRALTRAMRRDGVHPFWKQLGVNARHAEGLNRLRLEKDPNHGGDMAEWPEDIRIREFPR